MLNVTGAQWRTCQSALKTGTIALTWRPMIYDDCDASFRLFYSNHLSQGLHQLPCVSIAALALKMMQRTPGFDIDRMPFMLMNNGIDIEIDAADAQI